MFSSSLFDDLITYPGSAWKKDSFYGVYSLLKDAYRNLRRQPIYTGPGGGRRWCDRRRLADCLEVFPRQCKRMWTWLVGESDVFYGYREFLMTEGTQHCIDTSFRKEFKKVQLCSLFPLREVHVAVMFNGHW